MNKPFCFKMIFVLAVTLLFAGSAWCQNISGKEGETTTFSMTYQTTPAIPETDSPAGLPSGRNNGAPRGVAEKMERKNSTPTPLWMQLDAMSESDKQNACIRLEGLSDLSPALLRELAAIEALWNGGRRDEAIERLTCLEASIGAGLAAGICWIEPKAISGLDFGGDVQIGPRDGIMKTDLDFHEGTGNLFTTLLIWGNSSDYKWSMNYSPDDGSTWLETFTWTSSSGEVVDISASVVGNYCYVGYVPPLYGAGHSEGRVRRFHTSDGTSDSGYSYQTVFDLGSDIWSVYLVSNADSYDNIIYYFAILDDNRLVFYWAQNLGTTNWAAYATGITDAEYCLDAAYNEGYADNYLAVCYRDPSDQVHVAMLANSGWTYRTMDSGDYPTIAAYDDHILVAYEYDTGTQDTIKYQISYNGGTSWYWGYVADTGINHHPEATARKGGGISVCWLEDAGTTFHCWYRSRPYSTADWSTPVSFNDHDFRILTPFSMEWVPSADHNYGITWLSDGLNALFDRTAWGPQSFTLSISPDPLVGGANATFTLTHGSPMTQTFLAYSLTGPGSVYIPLMDVTLDISNPVRAGSLVTNQSGNGSWDLMVPPQGAGMNVWFQAVQYQNKTNVVATSVQ